MLNTTIGRSGDDEGRKSLRGLFFFTVASGVRRQVRASSMPRPRPARRVAARWAPCERGRRAGAGGSCAPLRIRPRELAATQNVNGSSSHPKQRFFEKALLIDFMTRDEANNPWHQRFGAPEVPTRQRQRSAVEQLYPIKMPLLS